jgi:serine/threonine protein kinase
VTVSTGSRLGSYEILSPLGAGGMGEVYRARDTRLGREVAVKVLPEEVSSDPERLRRFEREARAASALSHPNIVTIYEVARVDATSFIAMELVEGKTLRELAAGAALPFRKILSIAPQIAEGLAKAHAAGIVHRDLKPENVMVTADGIVKILDFGLAKLTRPETDSGRTVPGSTVSAATRPGIALGTVSYMSPEQASGHPVDYRSDQFSLGSMLYEMAAGKQAFRQPTTAQTLASIIEDEPEPIGMTAPKTPVPLRWVIERCLSKEPKGRYASTDDLARELSDLRDHISELSSGSGVSIEAAHLRPRWHPAALVLATLAALAGMYLLGQRTELARRPSPRFRQLTFRGAGIGTARFAPDGQTIVFSSQTEGRPPELLSMRLDSPEVRSLGLPPAQILSISSKGEMAVLLHRPFALVPRIGHVILEQNPAVDLLLFEGTLATASLAGGAPRELLEDVDFAEWSRGGDALGVVHRVGDHRRFELPIGNEIYRERTEYLNYVRSSFQGDRFVFKDWGEIFLKDGGAPPHGIPRTVGVEIAWSERTGEVWYTQPNPPAETAIRAVTPAGHDRLVATLPGDFALYDILADGRVLLGRVVETAEILGTFPSEPHDRNLSYFDHSFAVDLSASGDTLLFSDAFRPETFTAGFAYVRGTDGSPAKRLGQFNASSLSPDGALVLTDDDTYEAAPGGPKARLALVPIGPGERRLIEIEGTTGLTDCNEGFFPSGKSIFYRTVEDRRVWVRDLTASKSRPVTPPGVHRPVLLGDGRFVCARGAGFDWSLYPVEGGAPRKVQGILPGEEPIRSTPEGLLYVRGAEELRPGETLMTTRVYRLDPFTGRRELWKQIPPRDPRTGGAITTILFSADGKTCVWTHLRYSTELVLVEGLK